MKKIAVIGALGNMGRRYCTILKYLGKTIVPVDVNNSALELSNAIRWSDGAIIATPTQTHCDLVRLAMEYTTPVLCEKPFSTELPTVTATVEEARRLNFSLTLVNQYRHMPVSRDCFGVTSYNYWNHGKDGLAWDCISIIALAKWHVQLSENSPIWSCFLNGKELSLMDMDRAYISMVSEWMANPVGDLEYIETAHKKVAEYISKCTTTEQ